MALMTAQKPISDLMYDWLSVLHNKAEGLTAYEKYLEDARKAGSDDCVDMLRRLHEHDAQLLQEVKDHVFGMIRDGHEATR